MTQPVVLSREAGPEGLCFDLQAMARRRLLLQSASVGLAVGTSGLLVACGGGTSTSTASSATPTPTATPTSTPSPTPTSTSTPGSGTCSAIPSETAGPYPGDGTNSSSGSTSNVLTLAGVQRSDIRSSFGGVGSATATGLSLTVQLLLRSVSSSCVTPLAGYAVYLWHCDALGRYSLYSSGVTDESYLRGLQVSDSNGLVSFTSVFPGCYAGRWPHIHFEVFTSLASATSGNSDVKTSQLALPADVCSQVYAQSGYTGSTSNLAALSLATDNIFSDGYANQLAAVTGSVSAGYVATLPLYL